MAENRDYVVLKKATVADLEPDEEVWVSLVPAGVNAAGNKEAILEATKDGDASEKSGEFAPIAVRNFPVIPRQVRMEEVDDFGEPSTTGSRPRATREEQRAADEARRREEAGGEHGD